MQQHHQENDNDAKMIHSVIADSGCRSIHCYTPFIEIYPTSKTGAEFIAPPFRPPLPGIRPARDNLGLAYSIDNI
jgi:hypothetical protein